MLLLVPFALTLGLISGPTADPAAQPLPVANPATFAPLSVDPATIPVDANWLAHIEVDRLLKSRLFGALAAMEPDLDIHSNADFDELRKVLGFDPFESLTSVTVYGLPREEEAAVVMLRAGKDAEAVLGVLDQHMQRSTHEVDGIEITRWQESEGEQVYSYLARNADTDERLFMVAQHPDDLAEGVSALRGEADTLADGGGDLDLSGSADALIFVSASGRLADMAGADAQEFSRLVESMQLTVSETGSRLGFSLAVRARNSADAHLAHQIIQGGLALLGLASRNEPELQQLLPLVNSLNFKVEGQTLRVSMDQDIDELLAVLKSMDDGGDHIDTYRQGAKQQKSKAKQQKQKEGWY